MGRTGRPREFETQAAVDQAMLLFWERGYEATSLAELKAAMGGLSTASFYAAFGSKEALFRQVVRRYLDTYGRVTAPLRDPARAARAAVEATLRDSARMQTGDGHPPGCLIVLSAIACSIVNGPIREMLAAERRRNRAGLLACVARAVAAGELRDRADTTALATLLESVLLGISIQARDGVALAALEASITQLMGVWDALANAPFDGPS